MQAFNKIASGLNINPAQRELHTNYKMFGEFDARKSAGKIHAQMDDIWVRYGDINHCIAANDYSTIADEHDSIWLQDLPEIKSLCFKVMALVEGERLGGVLITKLPRGGQILPHTDKGWHAEYYDKYYIPIQNEEGAVFGFDEGVIAPDEGDIWAFDNSYNHWVQNNSNNERFALIICIKQSKFTRNGQEI